MTRPTSQQLTRHPELASLILLEAALDVTSLALAAEWPELHEIELAREHDQPRAALDILRLAGDLVAAVKHYRLVLTKVNARSGEMPFSALSRGGAPPCPPRESPHATGLSTINQRKKAKAFRCRESQVATVWSCTSSMTATSGVLSSPPQESAMSISVGSAEFVMLSTDGVVFDDGKNPLLSIRHADGRLLVTVEIRDEHGDLVAEMKDNEWKHQPAPAIFDRNYTQDALEIRVKSGRVALQVADLGSTVSVAAVFHCPNGWTYMAGPIGGIGSGIELRPPGQQLSLSIPAFCDYPSDLRSGSCPGIERLRQMTSRAHAVYPLYFPIHLCVGKE